jgi:hypothetical protein
MDHTDMTLRERERERATKGAETDCSHNTSVEQNLISKWFGDGINSLWSCNLIPSGRGNPIDRSINLACCAIQDCCIIINRTWWQQDGSSDEAVACEVHTGIGFALT